MEIIKKQVCSFVQAKKLHELGVSKDTLYIWEGLKPYLGCADKRVVPYYNSGHPITNNVVTSTYSAFTAQELIDYMPHIITIVNDNDYFLRITKGSTGNIVEYYANKQEVIVSEDGLKIPKKNLFNTYRNYRNLAMALADLLILIISEGCVDSSKLNDGILR